MLRRVAIRHLTSPGHLQQISLHVDDLVLAVPFAGEDVLLAIGLEQDGAVDEAVLVGAGRTNGGADHSAPLDGIVDVDM